MLLRAAVMIFHYYGLRHADAARHCRAAIIDAIAIDRVVTMPCHDFFRHARAMI